MKKPLLRTVAIVLTWLVLAAFDTQINPESGWQSIYQAGQSSGVAEHTTIADDTFDYLDPSGRLRGLFGRLGSARLDLVDLNASYFRADLIRGVAPVGDDPATATEERTLPPPGLFAGLPDYSYGLYDWANKNMTCPAFTAAEYTRDCHAFTGWLGAMNAVHFGSQAAAMYQQLHEAALALAWRARELREAMTEEEEEVFSREIEEAELLALAYEGYAQHFLQDRWAIGHMWERWGAPDPSQEDASIYAHLAIGALSGLIHGAEAVVTATPAAGDILMRADPMSSPLPGETGEAQPMQYRHVREDGMSDTLPAVGDERYADMVGGLFSLNRYDPSRSHQRLDVDEQLHSMRECTAAGWAEVIRALGPDGSGGYGSFSAPLGADAPGFAVLERDDCWNTWATNRSMMIGLLGPSPARSIAFLAAADIALQIPFPAGTPDADSAENNQVVGDRAELIAYATRLWLYARDDPDGTDVSRGRMTSAAQTLAGVFGWQEQFDPNTMWGFEQGGAYDLPAYVVPVGLATSGDAGEGPLLAESDPRGRDVQTLYGLFNGAQSDYWCEHRDILDALRADTTPRNRQMCEHLAQRMYQGTEPGYAGVQRRSREHDGMPVRSICAIRNTSGVESGSDDDPDNPYWLDQGYVPRSASNQTLVPVNTQFDEIANWCARVPVLELMSDPDRRDANLVAVLDRTETHLVLNGRDLRETRGRLYATDMTSGLIIELETILSWTDTRIEVDLTAAELLPERDYRIALVPRIDLAAGDTGPMPGLYFFRIEDAPEIAMVSLDLEGAGPCGEPIHEFEITNLAAFFEDGGTARGFTPVADQFVADIQPMREYLTRQTACMLALRQVGLPVMQAAQDSAQEIFIVLDRPPFTMVSGAIRTVEAARNLIGAESDFYSKYIGQAEALIAFLDNAEAMVRAWDYVLASDIVYQRNAQPLLSMLAATPSLEAVVSAAFTEFQPPAGARPEAQAQFTQRVRDDAIYFAKIDLRSINIEMAELSATVFAGLANWTRVEHSLVYSTLPAFISARVDLHQQAERAFEGYIERNECTGGVCPSANLDTRAFAAVADDLERILGSGFGNGAFGPPALRLGLYGLSGGAQVSISDQGWPTDQQAEAARSAGPD